MVVGFSSIYTISVYYH